MDELRSNILWELVAQINENSISFASLPDTVIKIAAKMSEEFVTTNDIAAIVQKDVALASRVIRIANSPALRRHDEITSIKDAVSLLGMALIRNLAICISIRDKFTTNNAIFASMMNEMLNISARRSALGLLVTKVLNKKYSPDTIMVSCLLSQIGGIALLKYIGEHPVYSKMPPIEVSAEVQRSSDELTLTLLRKWEMPIDILDTLFGNVSDDITECKTRRDIFEVVCHYIDSTTGESPRLSNFEIIDNVLIGYAVAFNDFLSAVK